MIINGIQDGVICMVCHEISVKFAALCNTVCWLTMCWYRKDDMYYYNMLMLTYEHMMLYNYYTEQYRMLCSSK